MDPPVSQTRSDMLDPVSKSRHSSDDSERPVFSSEDVVTLRNRRLEYRDSGVGSLSSATGSLRLPSTSSESDDSIRLQLQDEGSSSVRFYCGGEEEEEVIKAEGESDHGVARKPSFSGSLGARLSSRRLSVDEFFCPMFKDPEVQSSLNVMETTDSLDDLDRVDPDEDDEGSLTYETDSSSHCSSRNSGGLVPRRLNCRRDEPLPVEDDIDSDDDSVFAASPPPARHRAASFSSLPDVVRPCIRRERLRTCPAQLFIEVGEDLRRVADDFHRRNPSMAQGGEHQATPPANNFPQAPVQQPQPHQPHRWFMHMVASFFNRDHGHRHQQPNHARREQRQQPVPPPQNRRGPRQPPVNQVRPPRSNTVWYIN